MSTAQLPSTIVARGRLHRAIVSLPLEMCKRGHTTQERIVFFEGPSRGTGSHLAALLALAWGVDTAEWCERGFIYNISSARELLAQNLSDSQDARLLETGWGGDMPIHYACDADVDLFVTPQVHERLLAALQATAAIRESYLTRIGAPGAHNAGGGA